MKKIAIIGSGGSGKSTFAQILAKELNLPLHHLDSLYWKPGWIASSTHEWRDLQEKLCKQDYWIIDGNYKSSLDIRLNACDTVIFLDVNRYQCIYRAIKRSFSTTTRVDMAEGCKERFNYAFIKFLWGYPNTTKPLIMHKLNKMKDTKNVIITNSGKRALKLCTELSNQHENKHL